MFIKFIFTISVVALLISNNSFAQTDIKTAAGHTLITADSLASGNYKDVLSSFYQLALNNLTGPQKDLHFSANPFAIMLKSDPTLAENSNYLKPINRFWRRLNFDIDAKLDSVYHFAGFSTGIRFELLNKRDISFSNAIATLVRNDPNDKQYHDLLVATFNKIDDNFTNGIIDASTHTKLILELSKATNDSTLTFDKLEQSIQTAIKQTAKDSGYAFFDSALKKNPNINIFSERNKGYYQIISKLQNKPLWTLGINDTSYSNGQLFKSMNISSQFLKGIIHPTNIANLELDIKAYGNFTDDTLKMGRDFNRLVFNFEPGVNLVLKGKKTQQPYMEFKLSGSYIKVWKGNLYPDEKHITNTINGTLRIRVLDEIWIPIQVKYEAKNHILFGFLNLTTNFKALGNRFKAAKT